MRVLHRRGEFPLGEPGGTVLAGRDSEGRVRAPSDAANVRVSGVVMGLGR
jgi:hypothetical protein